MMRKIPYKKFISIITIMVFMCVLSVSMVSCGVPNEWKWVDIHDYGNMPIPGNWEVAVENGFMYIYTMENGERKDVLIQYYSTKEGYNPYFNSVEKLENVEGGVFYSNAAGFSEEKIYYKNGDVYESFMLYLNQFPNGGKLEFLSTSSAISKDIAKKNHI